MENRINNNVVTLTGEVASEFTYSHEIFGEKFYVTNLKVDRTSDNFDLVPIMVSERAVNIEDLPEGTRIRVSGQFRSYNRHDGAKNRLVLSVFVREIEFSEEEHDKNQIILDGYICKEPIYRETPLGREIADVILAVNRPYGKSDYIPCICWGRNARYAASLAVGDRLNVTGRIQSRKYVKKIGDEQVETLTAYEISLSRLEVIYDEK